ncbi:hypothetical protein ATCC90586_002877 [Pythium insidiosum]|nr:hypothetical protein ATCC90586_002877 [Pythium insidiosum]
MPKRSASLPQDTGTATAAVAASTSFAPRARPYAREPPSLQAQAERSPAAAAPSDAPASRAERRRQSRRMGRNAPAAAAPAGAGSSERVVLPQLGPKAADELDDDPERQCDDEAEGRRRRGAPARLRSVGHATLEGHTGHPNEDRLLVRSGAFFHLFAVMDGHGGPRAADFVVAKLFEALDAVFESHNGRVELSEIVAAVEALDKAFLAIARRQQDYSGACLVALLLFWDPATESHQRLVLNVGDCRVVLQEDDSAAQQQRGKKRVERASASAVVALSDDHCVSNQDEKLRALSAGAFIRDGRIAGVLEPFRSLGDLDMKGKGMKGWVIATPELRQGALLVGRSTFVLATDGVWGVLPNARVMTLTRQELTDGGDAQSAAEIIADEARARGSLDDITVIVVAV